MLPSSFVGSINSIGSDSYLVCTLKEDARGSIDEAHFNADPSCSGGACWCNHGFLSKVVSPEYKPLYDLSQALGTLGLLRTDTSGTRQSPKSDLISRGQICNE